MVEVKITIVGRNHYKSVRLNPNGSIFLRREPYNTHDAHAVAAYKQSGIIFGHVIRTQSHQNVQITLARSQLGPFKTPHLVQFNSSSRKKEAKQEVPRSIRVGRG